MAATEKIKPDNKSCDKSKKRTEKKKLSQFGKAMRKYRGWGEIVDMEAVLK